MFEIFAHPEAWLSLLTLTFMEVVLGIDNIIFISLVANRLPAEQQNKARLTGLALALFFRIGLLLSIKWIVGLTEPLFHVAGYGVTGRGIILLLGGLFLLAKSTTEIAHKVEGDQGEVLVKQDSGKPVKLSNIIIQIILLDIVFSFDSILTAVGLTDQVIIMIMAVIIAMIIMMIFAKPVSDFINRYPSLQILALSFLILIGFMLILEGLPEGLNFHVPKGYIYFAVFFSLIVEMINIRMIKKNKS